MANAYRERGCRGARSMAVFRNQRFELKLVRGKHCRGPRQSGDDAEAGASGRVGGTDQNRSLQGEPPHGLTRNLIIFKYLKYFLDNGERLPARSYHEPFVPCDLVSAQCHLSGHERSIRVSEKPARSAAMEIIHLHGVQGGSPKLFDVR